MFGDSVAWLTVILSITVSLLPAFLLKVYNNLYTPKLNQIASELQKKHYSELRPQKEYWFACLCCGKGANANVPVDGEESLTNQLPGADGAGVEMTAVGQKGDENLVTTSSESVNVDGPTKVKVFSELRKRL
jgi:hypothetical protein